MTDPSNSDSSRKPEPNAAQSSTDLVGLLSRKVVGQSAATKAIVPYVYMYQSGLAPEGRPAGVFLLLGPTGTGKTKTVEAIADLLHGSEKKIVKIDCGEFQMDHEVAKLIGAPPGYLGHRETVPVLTQERLTEATSDECDLALVLFDEIEKAAPSMTRLLLGLLDKGTLRLGDNAVVDFQRTLVFFTSNLGAREMMKEISPEIGFQTGAPRAASDLSNKLEGIALGAVRKRFSPEFVNRIDAVVTYQPLDSESLEAILEHDIAALQQHVNSRLGDRCFRIEVMPEARRLLLESGASQEYGARELKRTIHRKLTQPLATKVAGCEIAAGALVRIDLDPTGKDLSISQGGGVTITARPGTILIVDDNRDLLMFLATELKEAGWHMLMAEDAASARRLFKTAEPAAVLADYMLGEDDGLKLALEFQEKAPESRIMLMTGGGLTEDELNVCIERQIPVLFKPFLANDVVSLIKNSAGRQVAAVATAGSAAKTRKAVDTI